MTIDVSTLHNPYDFANPITNQDLFSGRSEELSDIKYYLDEATKAPRPMNLALLGSRASGKTSLLNMIEIEAKDKGFCVARIDLNESDITSPMDFFFKIFDALINTVCEFKRPSSANGDEIQLPFGGLKGKTYTTYLDMISTYDTSVEQKWCPFLFPLHYAKAKLSSVDISKHPVSDQILRRDFQSIAKECQHTLVLLFDECDCINNNVVLLEMIRNIFMNLSGYMLVFAGLPTLFPLMNDVFSPIIRQFKRIEISPYQSLNETRTCIEKPLELLGIQPVDIIDFETIFEIAEIHELSGGRPYEINLICHFLFKRIQQRKAEKMTLNLGVLEDVRGELEKEQDISTRPVLSAVRKLKQEKLKLLRFYTSCNGRATLDQLWCIETIFRDQERWDRDELESTLVSFLETGILRKNDDEFIEFNGDDFDKIYTKYFARAQEVALQINNYPLEMFATLRLESILNKIEGLQPLSELLYRNVSTGRAEVDFVEIAESLTDISHENNIYVKDPPYLRELLLIATRFQQKNTVSFFKVGFETSTFLSSTYFVVEKDKEKEILSFVVQAITTANQRAQLVDCTLTSQTITVTFPNLDQILNAVRNSQNRNLRDHLAQKHSLDMVRAYVDEKDLNRAQFHANIAVGLSDELYSDSLNNIGYLFLKLRDFNKAEKCFLEGLKKKEGERTNRPLLLYNYCVLLFQSERVIEAKVYIDEALSLIEDDQETRIACLLIPKLDVDRTISVEEKWDVKLHNCLRELNDLYKTILEQ